MGNQNTELHEVVVMQTCSECKCLFAMYSSQKEHLMGKHSEICKPRTKLKAKPKLDQNLDEMAGLKVVHGEHFYFAKAAVDDQKTVFRWRKEPVMPVSHAVLKCSLKDLACMRYESKLFFLRSHLQRRRVHFTEGACTIKVDKSNVIFSSMPQLKEANLFKELKIQFLGEKVNDAGGLLREWIHLCVLQIFERGELCIFEKANTDELCYRINSDQEGCIEFQVELYQFLGRLFSKALFERLTLDCYIDRTFIRQILGQAISLSDFYSYDKQLYKNWKSILKMSPEEVASLQQEFSAPQRKGAGVVFVKLDPKHEFLTGQNRKHYITRLIQYYTFQSVQHQIEAFRKGFFKIIPQDIISIFQPEEFEMMLYGVPFINVKDLRAHTLYKGEYNSTHKVIVWFWKYLESLGQRELRRLLQFITGSERVPVFGFRQLQSNRNTITLFTIESVDVSKANPYPKAHTCFNRLELPLYGSQAMLKEMMRAIVQNNLEGVFGLD